MTTPTTQTPRRIAVGISGEGRTLLNLLEKQHPRLHYQIVGVFASSPNCPGLRYAREHHLPIYCDQFLLTKSTTDSASSAHPVYQWLEHINASLVALAGFIRPFPISKEWENRVVNIHPALLPKYGGRGMYGIKVHQAVLAKKETVSGATVHYVTEHYDEGSILGQMHVPVLSEDQPETLAARVFSVECELYPRILDKLSCI